MSTDCAVFAGSGQKATTAKEDDQPAYVAPAKGDFKRTVKTLSEGVLRLG